MNAVVQGPNSVLALSFLNGGRLWLLVLVVALAVGYVVAQLQRRRYTVRLASAEMFESLVPKRPGWWRHIPAVLFLLAIAASVVAFARPVRVESVAQNQATIMIAIDVSFSMDADDVSPTRLDAAKKAATQFVENLPKNYKLGLVSFSRTAVVSVAPTTDYVAVTRAINNLQLAPGTAIGDAIVASLDAIESTGVLDSSTDNSDSIPAAIVLLSDGFTTDGSFSEAEATTLAREAGVPVSTISVGTPDGVITFDDPNTPENDLSTVDVPVSEENLTVIADETGGTGFKADSLDQLEQVYADIGSSFESEETLIEIGDRFSGLSILFMIVAGVLSLIWFRRLT